MALHLLIVDDDPILRRLYERSLAKRTDLVEGLKVDMAPSAAVARACLGGFHYDLALIDLNLGPSGQDDLSGLDLVRQTRQAKRRTEVVVMSSQDDSATIAACLAAGADAFVSKNSDFVTTLQATIDCVAAVSRV